MLIALAACLFRNLAQQSHHYFDAVMKMSESEISYIEADTEVVSARFPSIIYEDSPEPFDLNRELQINKQTETSGINKCSIRRHGLAGTEWIAGICMCLGFSLLIAFAIIKTYEANKGVRQHPVIQVIQQRAEFWSS